MDLLSSMNIEYERAYPTPYAASPLLPLLLVSLISQKHSPNTKNNILDEYDYIVVGAGSAGSVVASRLSELPCVNVLLLEAGPPPPRLTDIPALSFVNTDIDWQYQTTPQRYTAAGMKDRRIPWHGGKTLGGSSTINGMFYVRGNRRNYDEWAALGAKGWSYDEVLPYFKKLEDNTDETFLKNGYHATGGPITASKPPYTTEKKHVAQHAILAQGYEFVDPNAREQIGFYDHQSSTKKGQRCGTAKAYLVPAESRMNLHIVPNALVRHVLIENKKAVGVELDHKGLRRRVTARREVILSAGVVNTAQLLMLSGIGPMSELEKHQIPLVADLPVGRNFHDHPVGVLLYQVDSRLPSILDEIRDVKNILQYISRKTGPLTSSQGGIFLSFLSNSDNDTDGIPENSVCIGDFAPPGSEGKNQSFITCTISLLHPYSQGTVTLKSSDPCSQPEIDPNYFADLRDINNIVEGFKKCKRIFNDPAFKCIGAKPVGVPIPGCEKFERDEDLYLRCVVRTQIFTTSHGIGTARMGDLRDPRTVVDPQLRVKGLTGLRVVDASVMPTIPWGNTNIPTIMVAEKASDIIKSSIQCAPVPPICKKSSPPFPNRFWRNWNLYY